MPEITLGEQDPHELASLSLPYVEYPEPPALPAKAPLTELAEESEVEDDKVVIWSEEMLEQLIEVLYDVFVKGGGADNSFKKSTFQSAAKNVRTVYKGKMDITYEKCKNKWADLKRKWLHWIILSKQSGIGWVEEKELYDFDDYIWEGLSKSYPKIIWHKAHVMPFRDLIGAILHDVQANGEESIALVPSILIDPRLYAIDTAQLSSASSPTPSTSSKVSKTLYNRSKKRPLAETGDDSDDSTLAPVPKKVIVNKVDLGAALQGLSEEMARGRIAKEEHLTVHKKALKLLEKEYKKRMDMMKFIQACSFLKDEGNATTFTTLLDSELRDRWLEIELPVELLPCEV
jgi:hypothetical protein